MDALSWLAAAWDGFQTMFYAGALNIPLLVVAVYTAGAVLGWVARWDWERSHEAEETAEWLSGMVREGEEQRWKL